jgi:hypothetical protein
VAASRCRTVSAITCSIIDVSQSGTGIASAGGRQSVRWPARKKSRAAWFGLSKTAFLIEFTRLLHTDFLEDSVTGD